MDRRAQSLVIELIDVEDPRKLVESHNASPVGRWRPLVGALVVVLAVTFMISDRTVAEVEAEDPVVLIVAPVVPTPTDIDHGSYFIGRPGPGSPILGVDSDLAVVYVNSLGRPTVVDLDTGDVGEYEVSPTRIRDQFVVEFGEIVTLDPDRLGVEPAGERAIVFHVRRPQLVEVRGRVDRSDPGVGRFSGLELCLAVRGCPAQSSTDIFTEGVDRVELLSEADRADVMALFDRRLRLHDHRFLVIWSEYVDGFRVPKPLGDVIWLVHQPDGLA